MTHSEITKKGITIRFIVDKISDYYLDKSGSITYLDNHKLNRELQLCIDAKIKGTFVLNFKAISETQKNSIEQSFDKEINNLHNKLKHLDIKCNAFRDALLSK